MISLHNIEVFSHSHYSAAAPANRGMWCWGKEIVAGFGVFPSDQAALESGCPKPGSPEDWQARSLDGGETWKIERPLNLLPAECGGPPVKSLTQEINFLAPDFSMMFRFDDIHVGPSRFYVSENRCRSWLGPFSLSIDGVDKIAARTDYIVLGARDCIMLGSAAKGNGEEGHAFCARTLNGGLTWQLQSFIGPEPEGYTIMPSTIRIGELEFLTVVRHKDPGKPCSLDLYRSRDGGSSWQFVGQAASNMGGTNPGSLLRLKDGRLCVTYGHRAPPFGIRARVGAEDGQTWSEELVLRQDGRTAQLGYTRSLERWDGKVVTVYYFDASGRDNKTIQATIWQP